MSAFSEYCRQLLLESGSNVYQVARQSGLDRTSIQRMITGKRMPSIQFVKKFCSHLRITPIERSELLELYKIEKIGKDLYQNRLYIKTMIESIRQDRFYHTILSLDRLRKTQDISLNQDIFTDSPNETLTLLEYLLFQEFSDETFSKIRTNFPVTYKPFFTLLSRIKNLPGRHLQLQHLFLLNKAPALLAKPNYNLEVLHEVLPFAAEFPDMYFPRYLYSKSTPGDDFYYIYPYYLITSHCVLCVSSDLKKAVLYPSASVVSHYQHEFDRLYASSSSLISYSSAKEIDTELVARLLQQAGKPSHIACSDFYLPLQSRLLNDSPPSFCHFFSAKGFHTNPFAASDDTVQKRIYLMNYLNKCKKEEISSHLFKDTFDFPENLTILLYDTKRLIFLLSAKPPGQSIVIDIDESSICNSFLDFFNSMEESDLVHPANITHQMLAEAAEKGTG